MTETMDPEDPFCSNCGNEIDDVTAEATVYRYDGKTGLICLNCLRDQPLEASLPAGDYRLVTEPYHESRVNTAMLYGIIIGVTLVITSYVLLGQPADVFPLFCPQPSLFCSRYSQMLTGTGSGFSPAVLCFSYRAIRFIIPDSGAVVSRRRPLG
jgi:hypothetical protein